MGKIAAHTQKKPEIFTVNENLLRSMAVSERTIDKQPTIKTYEMSDKRNFEFATIYETFNEHENTFVLALNGFVLWEYGPNRAGGGGDIIA